MTSILQFDTIQGLITDIDGVLLRGARPLPGLNTFFDFLKSQDIPFILVTNNSTVDPLIYVRKLATFGVSITLENVLTCAMATGAYLRREFVPESRAYVVGHDYLREVVSAAGWELLEDAAVPADVVVVGGDYALTYDTLKYATLHVLQGARLVGTNPDPLCPTEEGLVPEAGMILAALRAAADVVPVIIGKPERFLFELAVEQMGVDSRSVVVLGDRLETDILGARKAGLRAILLTTGVDNRASIARKQIQPDAVFDNLQALVAAWRDSLAEG